MKVKSLVTQEWQKFEKKSVNAVMMDDYTNYVFLSNIDWVMQIEKSDRRYYVQNVSHIPDKEYFKKLVALVKDPETVDHFYSYLMGLDLTDFDPREIPKTAEKRAMRNRSMTSFQMCYHLAGYSLLYTEFRLIILCTFLFFELPC